MTATLDAPVISPLWEGPGLYPNLPADAYHADIAPGGSLSSTGARKLLAPSCPAKFRYEQDHGQPYKKVFDYGTAAHSIVLGDGPELVIFDRPRWDTDAIKGEIALARERGAIPLKPHEHAQIMAMADALRSHPEAGPLLEPGSGQPEQSIYWEHRELGITRRARIDWLRYDGQAVDYKTARSADLEAISKAVFEHAYHQQADWYLSGLKALGYANDDTPFTFIVQEKTAPYVVTVARLDPLAMRIGHDLNQAAMQLFANCRDANHWPGYSEITELVSLPAYIERLFN
jgi:hypothetical protein